MIFLALLLAAASSAPAPAAPTLVGFWQDDTKSVIEVYHCGPKAEPGVCARLASVSAQSPTTMDTRNPDQALRTRPLCGLVIGTNFHLTDDNHAESGQLYDPKSGKTYKGTLAADGDRLKLRGYVGVKLFGRTAEWNRVPAPSPCHAK